LSGGTHQLTVNQRPLNATLARQYDGTTTSAGSTLSGFDALQGGETLTLSGSGTAASANVANGITMSSNGNLALADGTGAASNYSLNSTVINIAKRVLNSSGSKIYDANTNALAGAITLSNLVSGEALNHSGTATISSANAGSYTISNLTGITIADGSGGTASNYTLTGGTHNFTVNPKVVSIQGNKTYDGNTTISSSDITSITGTVGSETLVMSSGTGTTSSQNAATYASAGINDGSLTLGNGSNGGLAANYTLTGHAASSFQINQRVLSSSGTRTYNGTTTAASSDLTLSNLVGLETLTLSGNGTLADANVATNKTVTLNTLTLSDNSGLAANYTLTGGTHQLTVTQKAVNTSGTRAYNSTTVVGSGTLTVSGEVGSEQVTITGNGSITDKNVGSAKTTNTTGLTLQNGSGGGLASNYTLSGGTHTYSVTQAPISFSGTRTYNATTNVEAANITLTGQQGGEDLTVTGVGSITSGNVGSGKTANVTGLTLGNGVSGTPGTASNYTFTGGTQTFNVTKAPLTISGSREYDGTQKIESSSMSLSGLQGGETLTINDSILTTSSNVGTYSTGTNTILDSNLNSADYKKITSQGGTGSVNWPGTGSASLSKNSGESDSDFLHRALGLLETSGGVGQYFVVNYTDATKSSISLANLASNANNVGGTSATKDIFTLSTHQSAIETATGKSASDYSAGLNLTDGTGLASNYIITSDSFNITQRSVTLSGTRSYNGTTTVNSSDLTIGNLIGSETLTLSGTGTIVSKDVGSNKAVTDVSFGLANNSGLAANYIIGTKTFNITKQAITIDGTKVYDGSTAVAATDISTFSGLALTETLTINGAGSIAAPQVGTNKTLTLGTLSLADGTNGGEASNYSLTSGALDVTTRPITLSGSRVYDATTTVSNSDLTTFNNMVSGESLAITGSGTIADLNVGTTKNVTLGTLALANNTASASNYSLSSATLNITQRPLNITATKAYDGNTTIASGSLTLSNLSGGQTINTSGSITTNSANVASYGTSDITVSSLSLANGTGAASNYTLSGGTYSASITQKVLGLTGSRVYNATTTASSSDLSLTGLVGSETLTLSGGGTLATSAVGSGKTITLNTLAISNNSGLASNYTLSGTSTLDVTARTVTVTGSRVYDGTTTINGTDLTTISNLAGSDTLSLTGSGSTTADVGNSKSVTLGSLALASGSGNAANYSLSSATVNITQRPLDLHASRNYDGTVTINGSDFSTFGNIVSGQTLSATGSGTVSSANVGTGKTVTSVNLALANGTGLATNYSINSLNAEVTGRPVTISGSRAYDSTTTASSSILTITSGVSGESLSLTGSGVLGAASAGTQTVTNNNTLAISNGTGLASNYTLSGATINVTVIPRALNFTLSREYDGTTVVSGASLTPTFDSLQGGETLALSGTGSVSTANVGSSKAVTLGTIALAAGSGNPNNYTLNTANMNVTQRVINLDGIRAYDATTNVLSSDITTFGNIVTGETLTISGTGSVGTNSVAMNKTITTGSLALGNGSGLASNYTLTGGTHTFDISPVSVNVTGNRQYNGTNVIDSSDLLLTNLLTGETVSLSGQGTVVSADVGANKTVTSVNLALTGANAGNYTLNSYTTSFEIVPKVINLSGTKVYDGLTTVPNASLTVTTGVSGQSLNLKGSGTTISAATGTGKTISLGTLELDSTGSGSDSNYTLTSGTHTFDITTRPLTFTSSRNYDGTTATDTSGLTYSLSNLVSGESLVLSGSGSVASKDVSAGTQNITLGTIALANNTGVASNYSLTSGTMNVTQKQVNLSGTKVYDNNATLNNSIVSVASGLVGSETLGLSGDVVTNSSNVGTYLASSNQLNSGSTNIALTNGSNGGLSNNYTINEGTYTITQRPVTISGTKVYDGAQTVSAANITTFNNTVGGQTLTISGNTSFLESQSVGSGKTINVSGLTLGNGTGAASNYSLSSGTFNVTTRPVTLTTSRFFDNTKNVNATNLSVTFNNLVGSETLSLSGLGSVSSENVASGQQAVTLGTLSLVDNTGVASNYSLTSATLDINAKPISLSGSKVYDASATASSSALTISGTVGGQTLTLTGNGTLTAGANVGTNKAINTSGLTLGNGSGGTAGAATNYSMVGGTYQMTVTQRPVTVSGSRFYDSTTNVSNSDITTFNNIIGGQSLAIAGSGSVSTAVAGSGKTISLGTLTLTDGTGLASNYSLSSGTFDIISRQVNIAGSRIYDGTTAANGSDLIVTTGVGSEILTVSGTGSISSANVGNNKSVTTGSLALSGGSGNASNYTLGTITLSVTQRPVNADLEKTYDGTANVTASNLKTNGISNTVLGHSLTLNGTGAMVYTDVGIDKSVSIGTLSLSGSQATNYTLTGGSHTIDVNPRTTNASGSRHYDGTLSVGGSVFSNFTNVVGSDTVTLSGTGTITTNPSVGSKGVSLGTLTSAHPNYTLGSASMTVTQRPVSLFGSRIADGNLVVNSSELNIGNLANSENLTLTGSGTINVSRPGTSASINLLSLSISNGAGSSAGSVSNYTLTGGGHFIKLLHKFSSVQRIRNIINSGFAGKSVVRTPSKTTHKRVPAIAERISISTPDQSVSVSPCVLKNGYCN
jgi:hypothetical protein